MHLSNIDIVKILCKAIIVRREQEIHNSFRYQKLHNNLTNKELHMKKRHHYSEFSKKEKNGSNCSNLHWGPCRPPNGGQGPVAPGVGDRGLSPVGGATGPPLFFLQGLRCKFEEKKLHLSPVAPHRATGYIFEIFQNRHIFLKF